MGYPVCHCLKIQTSQQKTLKSLIPNMVRDFARRHACGGVHSTVLYGFIKIQDNRSGCGGSRCLGSEDVRETEWSCFCDG